MREVYRNVIRDAGRRELEVMSNYGEENSIRAGPGVRML